MQLTPEQIKRAQSCNSVDELMQLATDEGISITEAYAQQLINSKNNVDLSEEELDTVAGGCGTTERQTCSCCGKRFDYDLNCELDYVSHHAQGDIEFYKYYCRDCSPSLYW